MKLSLTEAAIRLGKTERQIRYLIQQDRLPAEKQGGRWVIDSDHLPAEEPDRQRRTRREGRLRDAVAEALFDKGRPTRYSVRDMKAYQIVTPLFRQLRETLNGEHPALGQLRLVLDHLAVGCHRFARREKAEAYRSARDAASRAVCELLLDQDRDMSAAVDTLEQDLMPAMAGLLRRVERDRDPDRA